MSFPIDGSLLKLAHGQDIMPIGSKRPDNRKVAAFIREEAHRVKLAGGWNHDGLVGDGVGGVL